MAALARARNVIPYPERGMFEVYPGCASDQAHVLTASSAEAAAEAFLEGWHPALHGGGALEVTVVDRRTGETTRLLLVID
jgi:hypothetical protein